jgi:hypothetical protein
MKLSEKLLIVAGWLESSENDLIIKSEEHPEMLELVANALVAASEALYKCAEDIAEIEPAAITDEKLDEMAALADAFDESEDPFLVKQASVIDAILETYGANKNALAEFKMLENDRIEQLKKKYKGTKEKLDENIKAADAVKDIEKSEVYKTYRVLEAPLSTRCCIDHPGAPLIRVGENVWECSLDHKHYDYTAGFTTLNGNRVGGGDISNQTHLTHDVGGHAIFDTREQRLGLAP